MPLHDLDRARAEYLWRLHRDKSDLDAQLDDLAQVFGALLRADAARTAAAVEHTSAGFLCMVPPRESEATTTRAA